MLEFRKISIAGIPLIQRIANETWPDTFGQMISAEQIEYMLRMIYNEQALKTQISELGHHFLLITEKNKEFGFTSYELNFQGKQILMIHKLYILPAFQGLRTGSKVIEKYRSIAVENNNTHLRLKVFFKNTAAINFYTKNGFSLNGTEETDIGNGYVILDYVMTRKL